jgi:hypothetical protein
MIHEAIRSTQEVLHSIKVSSLSAFILKMEGLRKALHREKKPRTIKWCKNCEIALNFPPPLC